VPTLEEAAVAADPGEAPRSEGPALYIYWVPEGRGRNKCNGWHAVTTVIA
jgi:hypothetical protein